MIHRTGFTPRRKFDVIYTRGLGNKDMVVWHLMHIDKAVDRTLEKFFPQPEHNDCAPHGALI